LADGLIWMGHCIPNGHWANGSASVAIAEKCHQNSFIGWAVKNAIAGAYALGVFGAVNGGSYFSLIAYHNKCSNIFPFKTNPIYGCLSIFRKSYII